MEALGHRQAVRIYSISGSDPVSLTQFLLLWPLFPKSKWKRGMKEEEEIVSRILKEG